MSEITAASIDRLSLSHSEKLFNTMKESNEFSFSKHSSSEKAVSLREELLASLNEAFLSNDKYGTDLASGLALYRLLPPDERFGMRNASDDGIWRYLSLAVLPDTVFKRWVSNPSADRFWKNSRRIWLKSIWWYIHLAWQGSENETRDTLSNFSTDTIVQLVERIGRNGYRVDLYREVIRQSRNKDQNLFRSFMKLNTARILTVEPALYKGGYTGYVKDLYDLLQENL